MFFETVLKAFRNVHLQGVLTGKRVGSYLNGVCEAKEICHFFQKKIVDNFGSFEKRTTFALAIGKIMNGCGNNAEIAQLVEHNLAKVRVASSSLVFRSSLKGCSNGGIGRHEGLKIPWPVMAVRVQVPLRVRVFFFLKGFMNIDS